MREREEGNARPFIQLEARVIESFQVVQSLQVHSLQRYRSRAATRSSSPIFFAGRLLLFDVSDHKIDPHNILSDTYLVPL